LRHRVRRNRWASIWLGTGFSDSRRDHMVPGERQVMTASTTDVPIDCRQLTVRTHSWRDWPEIAPVWADLFESGRFSIFLSPSWVETWIAVFGASLRPTILLFTQGEHVQGACVLVETRSRVGPLTIRRVSLNGCGEAASEATYPEFNDLLCRNGSRTIVAKSL